MSFTNFPNGVTSFGVPVLPVGLPVGPNSRTFWADPANGDDGQSGESPLEAKATVPAAYALTTSGRHDTVFYIGGDTADTLAETLVWSNSHTHLIGLTIPNPGMGLRCRIISGATTDLTEVVTLSGHGCIFANVKIANESDADADSGAMTVSGERNYFLNCEIAGMLHATPAARAGSYSLTVSAGENHFERCTIGANTAGRAAANGELLVTGGARNSFWDCRFSSESSTAGKFAVIVSNMDRYLEFKDCLFINFSINWAQDLTNAISDTENQTHYIVLRGNCQFVGYTGIADTVTYIYGAGPAPNAGMFLSTQPTT